MAQGLFTLRQVNQAIRQKAWPNLKTSAVEYLVVGGGGGANIGGGGAGGLLTGLLPVATGSSLTVTIGAGATGTVQNGSIPIQAASSVFSSVIAYGGGGGGSLNSGIGAGNGASGGGEGGSSSGSYFSAGIATPKGQGNNGANNNGQVGGADPGGGGGGAGTVGLSPPSTIIAGNGGAGIASSISGTVTAYAGGGGGGYWTFGSTVASTGGVGGGAGGQTGSSTINGTNGTANTGGGGGAAVQGGVGGNGGSGIVIVSYPDVYAAAASTTGSPTVSTSGSGSVVTTGTTYLRYAGQTPFAFGSGDFTMESWVYRPAGAVLGILWDFRQTSTNGAYPYLFKDTDNKLYYYVNSASRIASSVGLTADAWSHVAICRSGTTTTMYINGVSVGTWTDTTTYLVGSTGPALFADNTNLYSFTGNISNLRFVKGVCVYTGAFTPPTGPLQATQPAGTNIAAITGTQTTLLLNTVSGAWCADSSTNGYAPASPSIAPPWNASSPFTVTGYKNRVYTWTSSGSITF